MKFTFLIWVFEISISYKLSKYCISISLKEEFIRLRYLQCVRFLESNNSAFVTVLSVNWISYSFNQVAFFPPKLTFSALASLWVSYTGPTALKHTIITSTPSFTITSYVSPTSTVRKLRQLLKSTSSIRVLEISTSSKWTKY